MTKYLDTSAWIEYFIDEQNRRLVDGELYYSTFVIIEIAEFFTKQKQDPTKALQFIRQKATHIEVTDSIAKNISIIKLKQRKKYPKFGILDAAHYACAQAAKAAFVTKDTDFKGLKDVHIL